MKVAFRSVKPAIAFGSGTDSDLDSTSPPGNTDLSILNAIVY